MISLWQRLRRALEERGVWAHWCNENEGPGGRPKGPPHHGRAWLHLTDALSLRVEWSLFGRFCHAYVKADPIEGETMCSVALGPAVWFGAGGRSVARLLARAGLSGWRDGRELGVHAHDGTIYWKLWVDPDSWESTRPRWRDGSFHPIDVLLGKRQHRVVSEDGPHSVSIPMPEGSYPANVVMKVEEWARPRWFAERIKRAHVDLEKPIPFSGKGENGWDCGDDGLSGSCFPARNIAEAVGHVVGSALETRTRRGDPWHWPSQAAEAAQ
jgi:hypothetical protein